MSVLRRSDLVLAGGGNAANAPALAAKRGWVGRSVALREWGVREWGVRVLAAAVCVPMVLMSACEGSRSYVNTRGVDLNAASGAGDGAAAMAGSQSSGKAGETGTAGGGEGAGSAPATIQAKFPAVIAFVRVQGTSRGYVGGSERGWWPVFRIESAPRGVNQKLFADAASLPLIKGTFEMSVLAADAARSLADLRAAALELGADLVMVYTLDGEAQSGSELGLVTLASLGTLPDGASKAYVTGSALLLDTRSGYRYATLSSRGEASELASGFTRRLATDKALDRASARAVEGLLANFRPMWTELANNFAAARGAGGGAAGGGPVSASVK